MRWHGSASAAVPPSHFPSSPSILSAFSVWFLVCRVPSRLPSCGSLPRSALLPFTPVPSDWLRQPLPAWVKSPGPRWKGQTRGLFPLTEASVCSQWKLMTSAASPSRRYRDSLSDGAQPQLLEQPRTLSSSLLKTPNQRERTLVS